MKIRGRHSGVTLTEMLVVVGGISLLVFFGLPAVRTFFQSFESESGTRTLIESALASAKIIAAKEQRYVGVRFQKAYDPRGPLNAPQYIVFIIHEPVDMTDPAESIPVTSAFRAVKGVKPIKLPDSVGVMDLKRRTNLSNPAVSDHDNITSDNQIYPRENIVTDTTSFSIIFSPAGKLMVRDVRVRNRDGFSSNGTAFGSMDDIFNTGDKITDTVAPAGMFLQDDDTSLGLGQEYSRTALYIYDRVEFRRAYENGTPWSEYLYRLQPIHVNAHTGRFINR